MNRERPLLITGAGGQLGRELVLLCVDRGLPAVGLTRAELDITSQSSVAAAIAAHRPSVIINAAAWTAVDDCEAAPDRALAVNGTAVTHLVRAAEEFGSRFIQISTDYVFSGDRDLEHEWAETDVPDPQTVYGRSKLAGEQAARRHTIVRTSWVSGEHGPNIIKTILRLGAGDADLTFVADQWGKPTFTSDLAPTLLALAESCPPGIFHATNSRAVSWFQFAQEVMTAGGFDSARVHPVDTRDVHPPRPAPRPMNSVLGNQALISAGFSPLRDFAKPLQELVERLTPEENR